MVMVGRRVLLRSLPVLFALVLAFFSSAADRAVAPVAGPDHPGVVTLSGEPAALSITTSVELPGSAISTLPDGAFTAGSGGAPSDVAGALPAGAFAAGPGAASADLAGPVSSVATTGAPATGQPTGTDLGAVPASPALSSQFAAGTAASRAPPAIV